MGNQTVNDFHGMKKNKTILRKLMGHVELQIKKRFKICWSHIQT